MTQCSVVSRDPYVNVDSIMHEALHRHYAHIDCPGHDTSSVNAFTKGEGRPHAPFFSLTERFISSDPSFSGKEGSAPSGVQLGGAM